jgi:hypothetical protein
VKFIIQLFTVWTTSIVQVFNLKQRFGDWIMSPSSGKSLLSWAQSKEQVPIRTPEPTPEKVYKPNTTKTGRWIMLKKSIIVLICHRHKHLDPIY